MKKENNDNNKSFCPKKERKPLTKNAKIVIIVVTSVVLAAILAVSGVFIHLALQAPSPDTDGIRQFLLKNEFSFGKVCQKNLVYTGGSVQHLTFEDDTAFQSTASKIQEVYISSKSKIPTAAKPAIRQSHRQQSGSYCVFSSFSFSFPPWERCV